MEDLDGNETSLRWVCCEVCVREVCVRVCLLGLVVPDSHNARSFSIKDCYIDDLDRNDTSLRWVPCASFLQRRTVGMCCGDECL